MDPHALECLDFHRVRELLAGYALTGLGKSLALHITPVTRADLVQRWLGQVTELQRLIPQRGMPPLGGISDVRPIVKRCTPPLRVSVEEIARLGDALAGTHHVSRYLADLPEDLPELRHLAGRIGDFAALAERIRGVIDERGEVRDDASPKLARIRREIENAGRDIGETVKRLLRDPDLRRLLQFPNPTFHNDRVVLPVRTEYRGRIQGIIHRTSDSGATIYVEPAQAVELNNRISNLRAEEQEEINRLLWDLAHQAHLNAAEILKTIDAIAVLDLIAAKVRFAHDFELRCPQISSEPVLSVRQARHPLLTALCRRRRAAGDADVAEVVPISYRLGEDFDLLVITGPNTGGKTVTLKTIGLLHLMVQAGMPVPVADGSTFGIFNNVLIDVGDEQNMQQSLSTFSAHLHRLMDMLRRAGRQTLVLMDELGAGTDPDEGAAIGRAILDEFLRLQTRCVATTHLGALKAYALTRTRVENASVEFDPQTLQPTYHLRIGESGSSNAIEVAQRLGLPKRLVAAARRNLSRKARALRAALRDTADAKRQAEQARDAAQVAQLGASRAQDEAGAARARLEQQQREFRHWVQRVVHLQPGDAVRVRNFDRDGRVVRVRLDQQRAEVNVGAFSVEVPLGDVLPPETAPPPPRPARPDRPPPAAKPKPSRKPAERERQAAQPPPAATAEPPKQPPPPPRPPAPPLTDEQANRLNPGDRVFVKRFHRDGRVVRVKPTRREVIVTVGLLEVEVPYDGLALTSGRDGARPPRQPTRRGRTDQQPLPTKPPGEPSRVHTPLAASPPPPPDTPPAPPPPALRDEPPAP